MSAIAGVYNLDGAPVSIEAVESMTNAMGRRGPDGLSQWVEGAVGLGHCMFRTTPESLEETQPLLNEDKSIVLVMDGRVDNFEALRVQLLQRGAVLRTRSDAELVLRAYEAWGEDCLPRIVGEFAFVVWDSRRRQLFGARDPLGARHFYYHAESAWFGFASEIKGLMALQRIEAKLNESRLLDYLVPAYQMEDQVGTFYEGVKRIPAGHAMRITKSRVDIWRYWDPDNLPELSFGSLDDCADAFLDQLRVAVKCRLRSITPVGAALSGGLDSSSIIGLIGREFRDELARPLQTFSLVLDDRERCHEWPSIRALLTDNWLDPTIIASDETPAYCEAFLDFLLYADEPFALSSFTASIVHDAARAKGCQVYLDGGAGDLLFYSASATAATIFERKLYSHLPPLFTALRRHGGLGRSVAFAAIAKSWLSFIAPEGVRRAYRSLRRESEPEQIKRLHPHIGRQAIEAKRARDSQTRFQFGGNDQRNHARRFKNGQLACAYERVGEIGLSRQMEPRSPFSDSRMIEFAIAMPPEAKFFGPWYKNFLRETMAGILPEEVRWRRIIGGHPGWKFWDAGLAPMLEALGVAEPAGLTNLDKWVDLRQLQNAWPSVELGSSREDLMWLLHLAVLNRWLDQHKV